MPSSFFSCFQVDTREAPARITFCVVHILPARDDLSIPGMFDASSVASTAIARSVRPPAHQADAEGQCLSRIGAHGVHQDDHGGRPARGEGDAGRGSCPSARPIIDRGKNNSSRVSPRRPRRATWRSSPPVNLRRGAGQRLSACGARIRPTAPAGMSARAHSCLRGAARPRSCRPPRPAPRLFGEGRRGAAVNSAPQPPPPSSWNATARSASFGEAERRHRARDKLVCFPQPGRGAPSGAHSVVSRSTHRDNTPTPRLTRYALVGARPLSALPQPGRRRGTPASPLPPRSHMRPLPRSVPCLLRSIVCVDPR